MQNMLYNASSNGARWIGITRKVKCCLPTISLDNYKTVLFLSILFEPDRCCAATFKCQVCRSQIPPRAIVIQKAFASGLGLSFNHSYLHYHTQPPVFFFSSAAKISHLKRNVVRLNDAHLLPLSWWQGLWWLDRTTDKSVEEDEGVIRE